MWVGVSGASVVSVLCSPAALQEAREDGGVQLLSVRGRQVGLTGALSRMYCLEECYPEAIPPLPGSSPQARDRSNHCAFPSLGTQSTPLLPRSPICIIDGHFRSVRLLRGHTGELGGAVHSLLLALYHTQSRCSIMNECICCRINTHSPVFAGAHTQLFLKATTKHESFK